MRAADTLDGAFHALRINELRLLGAARTSRRRFPDFLGIGAAKSGTTWLHQNLCRHPDLYLPHRKELRYFDHVRLPAPRTYTRYFSARDPRKKGEISPTYATLWRRRIRLLRLALPDLRLILLLRDPVERAWSNAQMTLSAEWRCRPEVIPPDAYRKFFDSPHEVACANYPRLLDAWLSYFDASQLFVGFYEELAEDPKGLLARVFRHLGVDEPTDWSLFPYGEVIRPGHGLGAEAPPKVALPDDLRAYLESRFETERTEIRRRFPGPTRRWSAGRSQPIGHELGVGGD